MDWFTADLHLSHNNIIGYTNRPFKNYKEMDTTIINNINAAVTPGDTLYIVGDFCILNSSRQHTVENYVQRIPGKKILIMGNHDYFPPFKYIEMGFWSVHTSLELNMDGHKLVLCHDPAAFCLVPKECILVCGHIHTLFKSIPAKRTVNIGVDVWDFKPVSIEQIVQEIGE